MDEQKQKLIDRINQAQNILVTVSTNPSVDQLAAAIGLTLVLNQMDKHGTAVFSGTPPSTIEFLKPEATLERNTDSLRDFIIALDKSKADKLRYKVEDQVVRIFITPYKTSLSEHDLEFSQGDFNVDVVVCLGVNDQQDLDTAITAHGRILHDATVVSVSTSGQGNLGSINWVDPNASSLSEMMVSLTESLSKKSLNAPVATALLTGIVANTERFRNDKTSPKTMSAAATLMAAGANQQLIATELETPPEPEPEPEPEAPEPSSDADEQPEHKPAKTPAHKSEPGTLEIAHDDEPDEPVIPKPEPEPEHPQIHVDENGELMLADKLPAPTPGPLPQPPLPSISHVRGVGASGAVTDSDTDAHPKDAPKVEVHRELMTKMPELQASDLTANTSPEEDDIDPPTEELTLPALDAPLLSHNESVLPPAPVVAPAPTPMPAPGPTVVTPAPTLTPAPATPAMPAPDFALPTPPTPPKVTDDETLSQIEQQVSSPHLHMDDKPAASVDDARNAVQAALSGPNAPGEVLQPIAALNAQPLGEINHNPTPTPATSAPSSAYVPPANLFSPAPTGPAVPNTGFSEPTPGTTPADETLDMPLPGVTGATFSPAPAAPVSPSTSSSTGGQAPPPPVPPPIVPPLQ